jgi:hypothetical protein
MMSAECPVLSAELLVLSAVRVEIIISDALVFRLI